MPAWGTPGPADTPEAPKPTWNRTSDSGPGGTPTASRMDARQKPATDQATVSDEAATHAYQTWISCFSSTGRGLCFGGQQRSSAHRCRRLMPGTWGPVQLPYVSAGDRCSIVTGLPLDSTECLTGAAETNVGDLSQVGGEGSAVGAMRSLAASNTSSQDGSCRLQLSQIGECCGPGLEWPLVGTGVNETLVGRAELT